MDEIKFKEKELIETIKKVSLEKGDILIFQIASSDLTLAYRDNLSCVLDGLLPEQTRYLILPKEVDINVINVKEERTWLI